MHIEDGILPLTQTLVWDGLAAGFVYAGYRSARERAEANPAYKPLLSMMGAAVFVVSALHLPVPVTGSSSHPTGTALAAIVVGPLPTVLISAIVLVFQAIFLGHGGITTLGANTFSMGVVGGLGGWAVWWFSRRVLRLPVWPAAALAGLTGDLLTYVVSAFELAVALHGSTPLARQWLIFFLGYAPTQWPLAVAEAVLTAAAVRLMIARRPDLVSGQGRTDLTAAAGEGGELL